MFALVIFGTWYLLIWRLNLDIAYNSNPLLIIGYFLIIFLLPLFGILLITINAGLLHGLDRVLLGLFAFFSSVFFGVGLTIGLSLSCIDSCNGVGGYVLENYPNSLFLIPIVHIAVAIFIPIYLIRNRNPR